MQHVLKQIQYRFAVITLSTTIPECRALEDVRDAGMYVGLVSLVLLHGNAQEGGQVLVQDDGLQRGDHTPTGSLRSRRIHSNNGIFCIHLCNYIYIYNFYFFVKFIFILFTFKIDLQLYADINIQSKFLKRFRRTFDKYCLTFLLL